MPMQVDEYQLFLDGTYSEMALAHHGYSAIFKGYSMDATARTVSERMKMIILYVICVMLGLVVGYIIGREDERKR